MTSSHKVSIRNKRRTLPVEKDITLVNIGQDSPNFDAFSRLRVSFPETIFDSKQIHNNQAVYWDDQEVSGSGTGSTWSQATAASLLTVGASTAGSRIRQTFRRFNYQPGKSQFISMTGTLCKTGAGGTGLERGFGYGDQHNGFFLIEKDGTVVLRCRTSISNASYPTTVNPVDYDTEQAKWNIDTLDGNGPSGIIADWTKSQILMIDLQWLGAGRVRIAVDIDGLIVPIHDFVWANRESGVYMCTPNLPCRYWITNDGTYTGVASLEHICCSIIAEGGDHPVGQLRYASTDNAPITAASTANIYPIMGIRLKTNNLDGVVLFLNTNIMNIGNGDYEWMIIGGGTISAAVDSWVDQPNSVVQIGYCTSGQTITGGVQIAGSHIKGGKESGNVQQELSSKQTLGSMIDGTPIDVWLCVQPHTNGDTFNASGMWNEDS